MDSLNTSYGDWIWVSGAGQYSVQWGPENGTYYQAVSSPDEGGPVNFLAGSEARTSSSVSALSAQQVDLSWLDSSGTWQTNWTGAAWQGTGVPPICGEWIQQYYSTNLYTC